MFGYRPVRWSAHETDSTCGHTCLLFNSPASILQPFHTSLHALQHQPSAQHAFSATSMFVARSATWLVCAVLCGVYLQVGCAQNCQFCFTGRMGLLGNLTTAQIIEQVCTRSWSSHVKDTTSLARTQLNSQNKVRGMQARPHIRSQPCTHCVGFTVWGARSTNTKPHKRTQHLFNRSGNGHCIQAPAAADSQTSLAVSPLQSYTACLP